MRPHSRFGAIGALVLSLALAACGNNEAAQGGGGDRAVPVTTEQVRMRPWSDTVQALGTVTARESVTVTAKVSETVTDVHFDSGDRVRAGAPLVTLSGQAQQAQLREAQTAANEATQLFRRQEELASQQLIARSSLDAQRAARDAANARVAQIRAQLADRVVRAPFSGVLGLRQVSPGALVTPGTPIATLDDIDRVYVDFPVPETALAVLGEGQLLRGTTAAYPARTFEGVVSTIDSRVDPATRAVTVRGDFANPDNLLRPGMLVQIVLSRPEREALVIPEIAIVQVGSRSYVWRVGEDDTVTQATVTVGARREGLAEVTEGLVPGDRIVVDGTGKLRPGDRIEEGTVSRAEPRAPAAVSPADGRDSGPGRAIPATPAADAAGSNGDEARGEDAAAPSSQAPAQPAPADRD
ncbi:efflux RND transporter periplasmic adaptor subunit [Novilysobacter selenitireducens]|uniref:Efflux RND transporter periplasmic adaptor subunit n=1 Tax=Novilysobacter selenitireducens TaxID=2872639 RepID=A0ABS7T9G8_9GAMM|nr:efflux RND transporter periplasmic adaptor subunit [Lysobacter selenitireducens]MBZ4040486.1 efflux RND transporter periplasmic adaptor subunit [Lysobacter selenitireducens]